MASVGRNDPCPCGSGRKHKHCCLHQTDARRSARIRLRQAESRVVPAVLGFALAEWGEEFVAEAWEEWVLWNEPVPEHLQDDPDFYPLFLPWFVFSYIPDPHAEDAWPNAPQTPLALAYLADPDDEIDPLDRQLIEAACEGGFSFHAVRQVTRGESIALKDILTGAEVQALEDSGSASLHHGDILFAHTVTTDIGTILVGCAPIVIPPTWHTRIIDFREEMWKRRRPTAEDLQDANYEIRDFFFEIADEVISPRPPALTNTDGERLQLTTLTYELRGSAEDAFEIFKSLEADAAGDGASDPHDIERNDEGTLIRATVRWLRDDTLLGTVTIEPGILRAEVNSTERAARIQAEIASRLGDRVSLLETKAISSEDLMAQITEARDSGDFVAPPDDRPPEFAAIEAEMTAQLWKKWLDEPVPALDNKTPRQAARSARGRERLEALFAEFQWRSDKQPAHLRVDVAVLRQALGL
jgi:hypothetical protein